MQIKSFGFSDVGRIRSHNEDSYLCNARQSLFIVADGIGGQASGEAASQTAVREVEEFVIRSRSQGSRWPTKARRDLTLEQHRLLAALTLANRRIYEAARATPEMKGMGTTLVAATLDGDHLAVVNVGDSRLYRVRGGQIQQLTQDHSFVEEQVRKGDLTREEARNHARKHVLTRALGVREKVKADHFLVDLRPKDLFLLCSDGLYHMLEDSKILSLIESIEDGSLYKIGLSLVLQANLAGGLDNITVVLISLI
ncbi:MAG: Stp1/IreP family PP2C-type Ser/Thr phosphatase [Thermodesulfobacteriota bacterium]